MDAKKSWPSHCKSTESNERISGCVRVSERRYLGHVPLDFGATRTGETSCEAGVETRGPSVRNFSTEWTTSSRHRPVPTRPRSCANALQPFDSARIYIQHTYQRNALLGFPVLQHQLDNLHRASVFRYRSGGALKVVPSMQVDLLRPFYPRELGVWMTRTFHLTV